MTDEEKKESRACLIYEDICNKLKELDYIIHIDEGDVPVIATTREGFCFWVKVEPCPYDWTKEEVEETLKENQENERKN